MKPTKKHFFKKINLLLAVLNLLALSSLAIVLLSKQPVKSKNDQLTPLPKVAQKKQEKRIDNPDKLRPNCNHSYKAEAYAYDAGIIRDMSLGKRESHGLKRVFLTFDDGVDLQFTPKILDVLAHYQVPATFFVIGNRVTENSKPILERQIKEGHAIALHSFNHDLSLLYPNRIGNTQQILTEANQAQDTLKAQLGSNFQATVWRYPGGHMSWKGLEEADSQLLHQKMDWIDWNVNAGDAEPASRKPKTTDDMLAFIDYSTQFFPQSDIKVILMHDVTGKEVTLNALPKIIEHYQKQGYQFGVLT